MMSRASGAAPAAAVRRPIGPMDVAFSVTAIAVAVAIYVRRTSGLSQPIDLGSDLANIAGFLAARADPAGFTRDPVETSNNRPIWRG